MVPIDNALSIVGLASQYHIRPEFWSALSARPWMADPEVHGAGQREGEGWHVDGNRNTSFRETGSGWVVETSCRTGA